MIWCFSSSVSTVRLDRYCFTFLAIWASSYSFLALRSELRRTRFLWAPPCTSNMLELVLPGLKDLTRRWQREAVGGREGEREAVGGREGGRKEWGVKSKRWTMVCEGNIKRWWVTPDEALRTMTPVDRDKQRRQEKRKCTWKHKDRKQKADWKREGKNGKQQSVQSPTNRARLLCYQTPLLLKSAHLPLCQSIAFKKNGIMQLGGRQLSLVCHAITVQNSRTFCQTEAKRVKETKDAQDSIWGILWL